MTQSKEIVQVIQSWLKKFEADVVAAIPVYNAIDDVLECINSLLAHTAANIPIIAVDDASPDARVESNLSVIDDARFFYIRKPENKGFVDTVNLIFAATVPYDVVVINSDTVFPANWLERLQAAAYHRSNIATATPFTNHGTIVSLPQRNHPTGNLPDGMSLDEVDTRIREHALNLYPILPTTIGHCMYIRRTALDVVGFFDERLAPGYGEEVDFSQRAMLAGFSHVLADDLFIYHKGSRSFSAEREKIQNAHEEIINRRYPWYRSMAAKTATAIDTPLARAVERAQSAIKCTYIALDATCLNGNITGTQKITLELIHALAIQRDEMVHLSIIVQDNLDMRHLYGLEKMVDAVVPMHELETISAPKYDLVHRNFQLQKMQDYTFLSRIARRMVISQLDFIAYANPGYAENVEQWHNYRDLAKWAISMADGVIFISQDVAEDAKHRGIFVDAERRSVIPPGIDHYFRATDSPHPPAGFNLSVPFLLILGTDFQHKNRLFGFKLLQQLIKQHQWNGKLVIAGPAVAHGSSLVLEEQYLTKHPELKDRVIYLPPVSEAEKMWLLEQAALLLYPSTYEGFGMVPFEAAELDTPTLASRMTSLGEVLGRKVITLDGFDAAKESAKAWSLLSNPELAASQIDAIRERAKRYTWNISARKTWNFYHQILALPPHRLGNPFQHTLNTELFKTLVGKNLQLLPWQRRLLLAVWVISTEGFGGLWREFSQYFRWIMKR